MMPADINDRFRAVHDIFGHLATGRGFARHGESGAQYHHTQMFPQEAQEALNSELRARNAGLIASTVMGQGHVVEDRPYATPEWSQGPNPQVPVPKRKRERKPKQERLFDPDNFEPL
jgi:hypothetical protein